MPYPRPLRHRGMLLAPLLAGALLAGCGGNDSADRSAPTPSDTTSPTVSATSDPSSSPTTGATPTPEPRPRVPHARNTTASAGTFARTVVESWGYALRHNEAAALTRLAPRGRCDGCGELVAELRRRHREGWHAEFPGARIRSVTTEPRAEGEFTSTLSVNLPASQSFYDDGTFRNDNPAHRRATFIVRSRFVKAGFGRPGTGVPTDTPRFALVAFFLR